MKIGYTKEVATTFTFSRRAKPENNAREPFFRKYLGLNSCECSLHL